MDELTDWSADCTSCGNIALARLRDPRPLADVVNDHESQYPDHYVIVCLVMGAEEEE